MNIFKILFAITLLLKISSAAKETSRRYKLLEFALPKHKHAVRVFLMLQEPWHLNVLWGINQLIDSDDYSPQYDLYISTVNSFLEAFKVYANDQDNCETAEQLLDAISSARQLLYETEDDRVRKVLDSTSIDTLDIYEQYTLEFYDRFTKEFQHFANSLSKEEESKEHNLLNWFEEFNKETNFSKKTEKFGLFFTFFEDELKYDTSVCKCLL